MENFFSILLIILFVGIYSKLSDLVKHSLENLEQHQEQMAILQQIKLKLDQK